MNFRDKTNGECSILQKNIRKKSETEERHRFCRKIDFLFTLENNKKNNGTLTFLVFVTSGEANIMKVFPRPILCVLTAVLLALPASAGGSLAAADWPQANAVQANAVDFVRKLSDIAITRLASKKISDSERVRRMQELLVDTFDLNKVGKFVLGIYYKQMDNQQFEDFKKLYVLYVSHNYAGLIKQYSGQQIEVLRSQPATDGTEIVYSLIHQPSGPPFRMEMRVRPSGPTYKALDLRIEGISMPLVHRKQFTSILQRQNGVQKLLRSLRATVERFEAEMPSE